MAYTAGRLAQLCGAGPGRNCYRYDGDEHPDAIEAAGYFNNKDDDLNLAKGDLIVYVQWSSTPFAAASTITRSLDFIVTNTVSVTAAAAAGNVNVAQRTTASSLISSLT